MWFQLLYTARVAGNTKTPDPIIQEISQAFQTAGAKDFSEKCLDQHLMNWCI